MAVRVRITRISCSPTREVQEETERKRSVERKRIVSVDESGWWQTGLRMKAIGRILTCVLLAAVFGKNVIATSAANIKFSTGQNNKIVRFNTTRSELVPEPSPLNPEDSRGILDSVFKNEDDQGGI